MVYFVLVGGLRAILIVFFFEYDLTCLFLVVLDGEKSGVQIERLRENDLINNIDKISFDTVGHLKTSLGIPRTKCRTHRGVVEMQIESVHIQ